ncbi:MAG: 5-guanidino-2-oxopentanoate decarboxylase, partial [Alphaproteobacteria bacterium]
MNERRICGEAVIALLEAYGVDTVFGIPGVHTLELYRGLGRSQIRHVQPRHEQGAGFMADGYARASGKPGVCLLITGPGVTNAATPIAQAYSDSVPMLVISSVNATADLGMGRGRLHEITSQRAAMMPLTGFSATAMAPQEVPELMARAFGHFRARRPRPVHIEVPLDVLAAPAAFDARVRPAPPPPSPSPESLAEAAELIAAARRPVIIAGGGTVDCGDLVTRLAEALGAAVVPTVAAKGVVPEHHPLCVGALLSFRPAQEFVAAADLVIAVGTELAETDMWTRRLELGGKLVRIDIDPDVLARDYAPEVAVLGDARPALKALVTALDRANRPGPGFADGKDVAALKARYRKSLSPLARKHAAVLDALRAALPEDGFVAVDMTQITYTACLYFPCRKPRRWLCPTGYGTLGYALPAATGAKLAAPERPGALLVGDCGLLFTVQELATAAELKLPLAIVLWNNDGLGQIRDDMRARQFPEIGVNPVNPDFLALALAFGCHATRPDSLNAFTEAVAGAFEADRPTLIEV